MHQRTESDSPCASVCLHRLHPRRCTGQIASWPPLEQLSRVIPHRDCVDNLDCRLGHDPGQTDELRVNTHHIIRMGWNPHILVPHHNYSTSHRSYTIHAWRQGKVVVPILRSVFMLFSGLGDRWLPSGWTGPRPPAPLFGCFGADLGAFPPAIDLILGSAQGEACIFGRLLVHKQL